MTVPLTNLAAVGDPKGLLKFPPTVVLDRHDIDIPELYKSDNSMLERANLIVLFRSPELWPPLRFGYYWNFRLNRRAVRAGVASMDGFGVEVADPVEARRILTNAGVAETADMQQALADVVGGTSLHELPDKEQTRIKRRYWRRRMLPWVRIAAMVALAGAIIAIGRGDWAF